MSKEFTHFNLLTGGSLHPTRGHVGDGQREVYNSIAGKIRLLFSRRYEPNSHWQ